MRVERLGEGTPEVAVVGAVHGDEPCGARAIERILAEDPEVRRPVVLIVANEAALEGGVRYVDEDLNRTFPGDPHAASHERRLAHRLRAQLRDCITLSLHSTQSHDRPFAIVREVDALAEAVCPHLSIEAVVESAGFSEGRLIEHADVVEVECGLQGSDQAADNAHTLVREFLTAVGALHPDSTDVARDRDSGQPSAGGTRRASPGLTERSVVRTEGRTSVGAETPDGTEDAGVPVLRLVERIPKHTGVEHAVFVKNFERVGTGEPFASTDGETLVAGAPFYPVLLSPYGYEDQFGYKAEPVGRLGDEGGLVPP